MSQLTVGNIILDYLLIREPGQEGQGDVYYAEKQLNPVYTQPACTVLLAVLYSIFNS